MKMKRKKTKEVVETMNKRKVKVYKWKTKKNIIKEKRTAVLQRTKSKSEDRTLNRKGQRKKT